MTWRRSDEAVATQRRMRENPRDVGPPESTNVESVLVREHGHGKTGKRCPCSRIAPSLAAAPTCECPALLAQRPERCLKRRRLCPAGQPCDSWSMQTVQARMSASS